MSNSENVWVKLSEKHELTNNIKVIGRVFDITSSRKTFDRWVLSMCPRGCAVKSVALTLMMGHQWADVMITLPGGKYSIGIGMVAEYDNEQALVVAAKNTPRVVSSRVRSRIKEVKNYHAPVENMALYGTPSPSDFDWD